MTVLTTKATGLSNLDLILSHMSPIAFLKLVAPPLTLFQRSVNPALILVQNFFRLS